MSGLIDYRVSMNLDNTKAAQARLRGDFSDKLCRAICEDVQETARRYAPRDTTALAQSISTVCHLLDDYDVNQEIAAELNKRGKFLPKPAVDISQGQGAVLVGAEYGDYIHGGTIHMPARPFLEQAFLDVRMAVDMLAEQVWRKP